MSQSAQQQQPPGDQSAMRPVPDCGEETYRGSGKLTGKIAVITGADSGIGRAVAIAFAREGADVVVAYLSEHDDARETARWVTDAGRSVELVAGDVAAVTIAVESSTSPSKNSVGSTFSSVTRRSRCRTKN